jgi:hypothetical protein
MSFTAPNKRAGSPAEEVPPEKRVHYDDNPAFEQRPTAHGPSPQTPQPCYKVSGWVPINGPNAKQVESHNDYDGEEAMDEKNEAVQVSLPQPFVPKARTLLPSEKPKTTSTTPLPGTSPELNPAQRLRDSDVKKKQFVFTDKELKMIAVWMKTKKAVRVTGHTRAFKQLLVDLGFDNSSISNAEYFSLRRKTSGKLYNLEKMMTTHGAITKCEKTGSSNYIVEFAPWTSTWLQPDWNLSFKKPVGYPDERGSGADVGGETVTTESSKPKEQSRNQPTHTESVTSAAMDTPSCSLLRNYPGIDPNSLKWNTPQAFAGSLNEAIAKLAQENLNNSPTGTGTSFGSPSTSAPSSTSIAIPAIKETKTSNTNVLKGDIPFKIIPLTLATYPEFKNQLQCILLIEGVWGVITGSMTAPSPPIEPLAVDSAPFSATPAQKNDHEAAKRMYRINCVIYEEEKHNWEVKKGKCLGWMLLTMGEDARQKMMKYKEPGELWKKLQDEFEVRAENTL